VKARERPPLLRGPTKQWVRDRAQLPLTKDKRTGGPGSRTPVNSRCIYVDLLCLQNTIPSCLLKTPLAATRAPNAVSNRKVLS
jgi:hypothetical protein